MVDYSGFRVTLEDDRAECIVEEFHEATKSTSASFFPANDGLPPRLVRRMAEGFKIYESAECIRLRAPTLNVSLADAMANRKSTIRFEVPRPASFEQLSSVMWAMMGGTHGHTQSHPNNAHNRVSPSAGALYPIECYVLVRSVSELQPGVFHLNALDLTLERISLSEHEDIAALFGDAPVGTSGTASFRVILSAMFRRTVSKYGARGYRYVLLEAGHIAQCGLLAAASVDLDALPFCSFLDDKVNDMLGLDGVNESAVYCIDFGAPSGRQ